MSKYKQGFTIEEATLFALDLSEFDSLNSIELMLDEDEGWNELYREANDLFNALKSETIIAYLNLKNNQDSYEPNTAVKTDIRLYQEWYTDECQDSLDFRLTMLTRESLSVWFRNMGHIEKADLFSPAFKTNIQKVNKFKKAFTAEHCALIATGLDSYGTIKNMESILDSDADMRAQQAIDANQDNYYDIEVDTELSYDKVEEAKSIKEVLVDEIEIASNWINYNSQSSDYAEIGINSNRLLPQAETDIVIYKQVVTRDSCIDYDLTLITKESFAIWLWKHGHEKLATNVLSNIDQIITQLNTDNSNNSKSLDNYKTQKNSQQECDIRTPDSSLIDSLAIMALLLSRKSGQLNTGNKPNYSQIKEAVQSAFIDLNLIDKEDKPLQISNLNRDLKKAVEQLSTRFTIK
ncbi:hypothetical protein L2735_10515 [Shewanella olleyana]|uniref:hypothetical protein n=1 Tax=Shewanella olleyana TaxID=135626 RepID=UPI00200F10D6|nr:hypothetical protein [Shewanella olleyana]MCL1067240.1 hypothetical protein [Shewanella olleyana]